MYKIVRYLGFQIKQSFLCMLRALIFMLVIVSIFATALFGYIKYQQKHEEAAIIKVGVVLPTDDSEMNSIIKFANGVSSLQSFCRLETVLRSDGMKKLQNEEIDMLIDIPDDFYESAASMEDAALNIYVHKNMNVGQKKLLAILSGVAKVMINTEGSIWSMYSGMNIYPFSMTKNEMEDEIMDIYIMQFLNRDRIYSFNSISNYGEFTFLQYYMATIFIMVLLVAGLFFFKIYDRENIALEKNLFRGKKSITLVYTIKLFSVWLCIYSFMSVVVLIFDKYMQYVNSSFFIADKTTYLSLTLLAFFVSVIIALLSGCKRIIYCLLIFIISIMSGIIIPKVYLPHFLKSIADYLPISIMHRSLLCSLWPNNGEVDYTIWMIMIAVMIVISFTEYNRRMNTNA